MGRPSNQAQRKRQIVDALLEVMAQTGYQSASISAIAKQAGLAPGLVHYHFKNKQAILIELVDLLDGIAQARYSELKSDAGDPKQALSAFIDSALALGKGSSQHAVTAWVMIAAESIKQKEVQVIYQKVVSNNLDELESLIMNFVKHQHKKIARKTIKNISALVYSSIEGCYQLASTAPELMPSDYASQTLKDMLFALLENQYKNL